MNFSAYPLTINGHPARIELDISSDAPYKWVLRGAKSEHKGAAKTSEGAIEQMEQITSAKLK